jgi:Ca-activated chloride channel family protein
MMGHALHFLRPDWLWALIPAAILLLMVWLGRNQRLSQWQQVIDPHLLPYLTKETNGRTRSWGYLVVTLATLFAIIAMAGPSWTERHIPVHTEQTGSVIVLDLSPNMLATDLKPNRLLRARYKIRDILNEPVGTMGLVVYAGESYIVSPLTQDHKTIAAFLNDLTPVIMPVSGQNLSAGINKAAQILQQSGLSHGDILVITSANEVADKTLKSARKLHDLGYAIHVLGVGTTQGAPLKLPDGQFIKDDRGNIITRAINPPHLKKLAKNGGGQYIAFTNNHQDVTTVISYLKQNNQIKRQAAEQTQHIFKWVDQGYLLVWLLLPLALVGFRRGYLEAL